MKHLANILIIILVSSCGWAQDSFNKGNKAYLDAKYEEALTLYEEAISEEPNNISALFNLGMTNVQLKNYGEAIWAFEGVLQKNPADDQAEEQIRYIYSELGAINEWEHVLGPFERALFSIPSSTWALLSILLSILGSTVIILGLIRKQSIRGKYVAVFSITLFALMIMCSFVSYKVQSFESESQYAIVTDDQIESYLNKDLSNNGPQLILGNRLHILSEDTVSNIVEVQDVNNNIYFVQSEDIKRL